MAPTSTFRSIIEQVVQEAQLGVVLPGKVAFTSTTSMTLADAYGEGPFTGSQYPIGSPVKITSPADGGVPTSMTTTLLIDSTKVWVASEWINFTLRCGNYKATITANTTTTLTYAAIDAAPPVGTPYTIELGDTFIAGYVPSTGVYTLNPALASVTLNAAQVRPQVVCILDPKKGIDRFDRIKETVNRALNNRITRWQRNPLTFVPDGDLQGTVVTDYWTGTAASQSYVSPTFPAGGAAAAFSFAGIERVLQSVTTNATNNVKCNTINIALNSQTTAYQWYFQTAIRVVSGTGNAQILAWDETNGVQITVNVVRGSDTFTMVTNSLGFINMAGTLNIPATCKQISFRLVSSATATTIQMTPLIAYPTDATSFPIPNRIISTAYLGNYHYALPTTGASGPYSVTMTPPITVGGRTHSYSNFGDHITVNFNFLPILPVWFDELTYDPPLNGMLDVTTFPLDQVVKWTKYELFKMLYVGEEPQYRTTSYGASIPIPSKWKTRTIEAKREAERSDYEPEVMKIEGRV